MLDILYNIFCVFIGIVGLGLVALLLCLLGLIFYLFIHLLEVCDAYGKGFKTLKEYKDGGINKSL